MGQALRRLGASTVALGVVGLGIVGAAVPSYADPGGDNPSRNNPNSANYVRPAAPRSGSFGSTSGATSPTGSAGSSPAPLPTITLPAQSGYESAGATPLPSTSPTASASPALPPGFAATDVGALSASGTPLAGVGGTWLALGVIGVVAAGASTVLVIRRR